MAQVEAIASCQSASAAALPLTLANPPISISAATRCSACSTATRRTTRLPIEWPTTTARAIASASITPTTSLAKMAGS